MDKKAQGLPITTIIIAILGLVVLVILFAILTGRLAIFAGAANECPGVCVASDLKGAGPTPALESSGLQERPTYPGGCNPDTERKIFGRFIARGIRGTNDAPIPCNVACCQPLG